MRYWTTAMRTIYLYASENVVFYRGLTPSIAIVSCELVPGQTQVLPYEPRHVERRLPVSGLECRPFSPHVSYEPASAGRYLISKMLLS